MADTPQYPSRRAFLLTGIGAAAALTIPAARYLRAAPGTRLSARPRKPTRGIEPGVHPLGLASGGRDALIYVPASYDPKSPAPLMLSLHGATQAGQLMTTRLQSVADALGCPVLAPDSRGVTWDAIRGDFDVDVAFIDRALAWTFDRVNADAKRIWLSGFSDGASYGLSLGLANGDFFSRVLAFSPGFVIPAERVGKPRVFVSHGRQDQILPIDRCSRVLVPQLTRDGYDVRFDEFDGGHRMPPEILEVATGWLRSA
jgi:phospholipase/carboxylesterase